MNYKERVFINKGLENFGKAFIFKKWQQRVALYVFCMITPLTNWLLFFANKIIRNDIIIRW